MKPLCGQRSWIFYVAKGSEEFFLYFISKDYQQIGKQVKPISCYGWPCVRSCVHFGSSVVMEWRKNAGDSKKSLVKPSWLTAREREKEKERVTAGSEAVSGDKTSRLPFYYSVNRGECNNTTLLSSRLEVANCLKVRTDTTLLPKRRAKMQVSFANFLHRSISLFSIIFVKKKESGWTCGLPAGSLDSQNLTIRRKKINLNRKYNDRKRFEETTSVARKVNISVSKQS